ncbi:alpha-tubulin N-acetyltransferase 1 isoform X2 [Channa argus]|uniref:alpha-tubulin N-acetyltransferase 1 isoform X2 n=1 Tax=Channa argus TaxID=215402 RepID=UPI003522CEC6
MEFPFDINHLFSERVTVLDQNLVAGRKTAGRPDLQANTATVIDELGKASAKAQQLPAPITSASKLQSQKHQLYLLKDGESNGGRGVVVGFLKVGYKKLFLLHKNLEPVTMAYDRPSPKFLSFLAKHYCLTESVPQVNNFVVFEGFFLNRAVAQLRKVPLKKPDGEIKPYSVIEREAVRQEQRALPWPFAPPHSPQRLVSSQYSHSLSVGSSPSRAPAQAALASAPGSNRDQNPQSPQIERCRARRTSKQGLVARCSLYSGDMDSRAAVLLDNHFPGLRTVGDQSYPTGYTDKRRVASFHTPQFRSQALSLPPLPVSKKNGICSQTSLKSRKTHQEDSGVEARSAEEIKVLDFPHCNAQSVVNKRHLLEKESNRSQGDWSWTLGVNCYTTQWVKQKQEYRSTQPW